MKAIAAALILLLPGASASDFRFSRSVEAPSGWSRTDLPDDVLDACRAGLPDLRLRDAAGEEVPFAFAPSGGVWARFDLINVESQPKRETIATIDRGRHPPLAGAATLEIAGDDFLKPVLLEASDDGSLFREVLRGSIFAKEDVRSTTLRFAPNDRRYWRFRFDDRNGDPVRPVAVRVAVAEPAAAVREIPLPFSVATRDRISVITAGLPAANLAVTSLRFAIDDPAFVRRVRIFERVFFRDEVSRRLIGGALIQRTGSGEESLEIPVCDLSGKTIEIEIDDGDSPALHITQLTARSRPRSLLFYSSANVPLTLLYGSPSAPAVRYDLDAAVRRGPPRAVAAASLGPAKETGAPAPAASTPRGAPMDASGWKMQQRIDLPSSGRVAYLDLPGPVARHLSSLRILDGKNRPVPYIVEQNAHQTNRFVVPRVRQDGRRTLVDVSGLDPSEPVSAVSLDASAPAYFSRDLTAFEPERDERGDIGNRVLGSAHWERRPGDRASTITISVAAPRGPTLTVAIENGDNPALTISGATLAITFVRIDFAFEPGDSLTLVFDNSQATSPHYDLSMVAGDVLAAPALPAHLRPPEVPASPKALPRWFWAAVVAAALLVAAALARTLRSESGPSKT
ncbi:MAG TPA: hypothetical protein VF376_07100 [Thermoanaerobaculia bacterium]